MNVEARSQTTKSVFKKGQFFIPEYQREFDWAEVELDEFFSDLDDANETDNYFIGHMVFEGEYSGTKFNVIDGQQRFTVITITLCAIRDKFFEMNEDKLANGIHENYIFAKDENYDEYVILDNKMPYPILQKYIQNKPTEKEVVTPVKNGEKKIVAAYDFVKEYIKSYTVAQLTLLRDKILNLELIFVSVSEEVDAFTIFETLNAKGKDLTPLDLIKNQIFKFYPKSVHLDEPNDTWKTIIENTKDGNFKFLNSFWASRYKKVSDRKIYKEFVNKIIKEKTPTEIKDFVINMKSDSSIFKSIKQPFQSEWKNAGEYEVYLSLEALQIFNIEVANSILISLLREYKLKNISLEYCKKALKNIEKFHFINNAVAAQRSSGLDTMYSKIAKDLFIADNRHNKHSVIDEMIKKLNLKLPKKNIFEEAFDTRLYFSDEKTKQKKLVQYALKKLEYHSQNYNIDLKNISLEHIYPESPDLKKWKILNNSELAINIANIVLLDQSINSSIGNKPYLDKKKIVLDKSTLVTTKKVFTDNEKWDEKEIKNRKKQMIDDLFENIWK